MQKILHLGSALWDYAWWTLPPVVLTVTAHKLSELQRLISTVFKVWARFVLFPYESPVPFLLQVTT